MFLEAQCPRETHAVAGPCVTAAAAFAYATRMSGLERDTTDKKERRQQQQQQRWRQQQEASNYACPLNGGRKFECACVREKKRERECQSAETRSLVVLSVALSLSLSILLMPLSLLSSLPPMLILLFFLARAF